MIRNWLCIFHPYWYMYNAFYFLNPIKLFCIFHIFFPLDYNIFLPHLSQSKDMRRRSLLLHFLSLSGNFIRRKLRGKTFLLNWCVWKYRRLHLSNCGCWEPCCLFFLWLFLHGLWLLWHRLRILFQIFRLILTHSHLTLRYFTYIDAMSVIGFHHVLVKSMWKRLKIVKNEKRITYIIFYSN